MSTPADLAELRINRQRLEGHYSSALATVAEPALRDLAHSMRLWVDMKDSADAAFETLGGISLRTSLMGGRELKAALRSRPDIDDWFHVPFSLGLVAGGMEVGGVLATVGAVPLAVPGLRAPAAFKHVKGLARWLSAEVAELSNEDRSVFGNSYRVALTRELAIKRVANTLGGSHPRGSGLDDPASNRFDRVVQRLHGSKIFGFPLTYYMLLESAMELLEATRPLLHPIVVDIQSNLT